MYSVTDYGWMLDDRLRRHAFLAALDRLVREDSVVLDLGSGPGLLSLYALKRGARRVYAVDINPAVKLLKKVAPREIAEGRLVVFHGDAMDFTCDQPADVVIADIRGPLSLVGGSFDVVKDAIQRLARPGATIVPGRERFHVAPVTEGMLVDEIRRYWNPDWLEWDLSAIYRFEMGQIRRSKATPSDLLASGRHWATLNWDNPPRLDWQPEVRFRIERDARLDGFLQWFDLDFDDGSFLSNAPGAPDLVYGRCSFMLSEPIDVGVGDEVILRMKLQFARRRHYWSWEGEVTRSGYRSIRFEENSMRLEILNRLSTP